MFELTIMKTQTRRGRRRCLPLIFLIAALPLAAIEETPEPKAAEIRIDENNRVLLSRDGKPLAAAQIRTPSALPVIARDEALKNLPQNKALESGNELLRELIFPATPQAPLTNLLLRARAVKGGARLLVTSSGEPNSNATGEPGALEIAVEIFADSEGKLPEYGSIDGKREPLNAGEWQKVAGAWSLETKKIWRVDLVRSAPVLWKFRRLPGSLLFTARLLADPYHDAELGSFVLYLGSGMDGAAPELSPLRLNKAQTPARDFIEGTTRVYASGANPYSLSDVAVVAEIALPPKPDGEVPIKRLPCFFWQSPDGKAEGEFRFRFAPPIEGLYGVRIVVVSPNGQVRSEAIAFRAGPPVSPGFTRARPNERFFRKDDGTLFVPLGLTLPPAQKINVAQVRALLVEMGRSQLNVLRMGVSLDSLALESSAGQIDGAAAGIIDEILQAAQVRNIQVILSLESGADLGTRSAQHPYFREKGGPLLASAEFFRDPKSKKLFGSRLTYAAARYGPYRSLLAFELIDGVDRSWAPLKFDPEDRKLTASEIDLTRRARRDVQEWADEMALHLKGMDQHGHPICISSALSPQKPWADLEACANLSWAMYSAQLPDGTDPGATLHDWLESSKKAGRAQRPWMIQLDNSAPAIGGLFASIGEGLAAPLLSLPEAKQIESIRAMAPAAQFAADFGQIVVDEKETPLRISENLESAGKVRFRMEGHVFNRGLGALIRAQQSTAPISDLQIRLTAPREGRYAVYWINVTTGKIEQRDECTAPPRKPGQAETIILKVPPFQGSIAVIVLPETTK